MLLREIRDEDKDTYNSVVSHPLQSWEWGEFRKKTGQQLERLGFFEQGHLKKALQVTFHSVPVIGGSVGYVPKGYVVNEDQLAGLKQLGKKHNAIFIKLEPNNKKSTKSKLPKSLVPGRPLFTKYTFQLDLSLSEDQNRHYKK